MKPLVTALLALLTAAPALTGCTSDGQVGENGIIRFSQVVHFADTDDFNAPLASGRTLLVALQEPQALGIDQETKADFTMEVREDGDVVQAAWPLGFAQYAINLEDEGSYQLVALKNGQPVDQLSFNVKDPQRIRYSQNFFVLTDYDDPQEPNTGCTRSASFSEGLEGFLLHSNQTITVHVVPEDKDGAALLGLLPITAVTSDVFHVNAQLVGHSALANSLTLSAPDPERLGEPQQVTVREQWLEQDIVLTLNTTPEPFELDCDQP